MADAASMSVANANMKKVLALTLVNRFNNIERSPVLIVNVLILTMGVIALKTFCKTLSSSKQRLPDCGPLVRLPAGRPMLHSFTFYRNFRLCPIGALLFNRFAVTIIIKTMQHLTGCPRSFSCASFICA
jgi:hypothetical protein